MRHITPFLALALLLGGTGIASAQEASQEVRIGAMRISHSWAPATSETSKDAPGYVTMTNTGSVPDRLKGGSFIESAHVETHTMTGEGRKAKMTRVDGIVVNPGETVTLKPGGDHLMFIDLRSALKAGTTVQSILSFERSGTGEVDFAIEGKAPAGAKGRHAGH